MKIEQMLSSKRYEHCVRTKKMAKKLCEIHKIDKKAIIAAYLHDIAKELSLEEMIELVGDEYRKEIDGMYNKNILHGFAGAKFCELKLNITDPEILSAIRFHTIGKEDMSDIEKVVYISDAIEEGRKYEGVDKIREKTYENLDEGILEELNYKIKNLLDRNIKIHKNTILFRNSLLGEK